jgi:hypothetical protein
MMPGVVEPGGVERPGRSERMDASTEQFLWGGRMIGYLAALGVFVLSVVFGVLVVRPWERPTDSAGS